MSILIALSNRGLTLHQRLGSRFALKKVRLDNEREGFPITAVREIKILRQLTHTNVVQLMDIVTDQTSAADLRTNNGEFFSILSR